MADSEIVKMSILVHAMYTVTNMYRKKACHCDSEVTDALAQVVKDVCADIGIPAFDASPARRSSIRPAQRYFVRGAGLQSVHPRSLAD